MDEFVDPKTGTTITSKKASGGVQGDRDVLQKITETLGTKNYMILVSTLDQDTKKLTHFRHSRNFPWKDITPSLQHYNEEFRKDKIRGLK